MILDSVPQSEADSSGAVHPVQDGQVFTVRTPRNLQDVNGAKAARRVEIERRCADLKPPLLPDLLVHMESFQAALQIPTTLTETAWEILRPRLLAQREEAQAKEIAAAECARASQAFSMMPEAAGSLLPEGTHDALDREWELAQTPILERLGALADQLISERWLGGTIVATDNAPNFAADILLSSRERFQAGWAGAARIASNHLLEQLPDASHKLTLENMKWLYDQKVKGLAEPFQKELFLCNECDANSKFYGFEAVIQHYAAKHTSALSLGNVVVNWRAEWPDRSPFRAEPCLMSAVSQGPAHWSAIYPTGSGTMGQQNMAQLTHASLGSAAYPHTSSNSVLPPGFVSANSPATVFPAHAVLPTYTHDFQAEGNAIPYTANQPIIHRPHLLGQFQSTYAPSQSGVPVGSSLANSMPRVSNYSTPASQVITNVPSASSFAPGRPAGDLYHTQLQEMAKHARDVWFAISGIKDMPQSVRIYIVVQHVAARFAKKYTNEPSLSMFVDGLDHNALMRPVRSLNGLGCKTCVSSGNPLIEGISPPEVPQKDKKLYTLPHLLNHFRTAHLERRLSNSNEGPNPVEVLRLDWKRDMIELPEATIITNLANAPGIDDRKLELIAWVFPDLFLAPTSGLATQFPRPNSNSGTALRNFVAPEQVQTSNGTSSGKNWVDTVENRRVQSPQEGACLYSSPQLSDSPGEDEYDPHRPAYLGRIVESRQVGRPSFQLVSPEAQSRSPNNWSTESGNHEQIADESFRRYGKGAYSDRLLRHQDRSSRDEQGRGKSHALCSFHYGNRLQENGVILVQATGTPQRIRMQDTKHANVAEADKFLSSIGPVPTLTGARPATHDKRGFSADIDANHLHSARIRSVAGERENLHYVPRTDVARDENQNNDPFTGEKFGINNSRDLEEAAHFQTGRSRASENTKDSHLAGQADPPRRSVAGSNHLDDESSNRRQQPMVSFARDSRRDHYHQGSRSVYTESPRSQPMYSDVVYYELPPNESRSQDSIPYETLHNPHSTSYNGSDRNGVELIYAAEDRFNRGYSGTGWGERSEVLPLSRTGTRHSSAQQLPTLPSGSCDESFIFSRESSGARSLGKAQQVYYIRADH